MINPMDYLEKLVDIAEDLDGKGWLLIIAVALVIIGLWIFRRL